MKTFLKLAGIYLGIGLAVTLYQDSKRKQPFRIGDVIGWPMWFIWPGD